jgi:hypothetical protein
MTKGAVEMRRLDAGLGARGLAGIVAVIVALWPRIARLMPALLLQLGQSCVQRLALFADDMAKISPHGLPRLCHRFMLAFR